MASYTCSHTKKKTLLLFLIPLLIKEHKDNMWTQQDMLAFVHSCVEERERENSVRCSTVL